MGSGSLQLGKQEAHAGVPHLAQHFLVEEAGIAGLEAALVLLRVEVGAEGHTFLAEERGADTGALGGRDAHTHVGVAAAVPRLIPPAAAAGGRREGYQLPAGHSEKRAARSDGLVLNATGLVDDQQARRAVAADGGLAAG
jgi:hypothetical protein